MYMAHAEPPSGPPPRFSRKGSRRGPDGQEQLLSASGRRRDRPLGYTSAVIQTGVRMGVRKD
jgi:hypothetical protein